MSDKVQVTLTKVGSTDNISNYYSFTQNKSDWRESHLRFNNPKGTGTYVITIQDYYYCTATSITVNVKWFDYSNNQEHTVYVWAENTNAPNNTSYKYHAKTLLEAYQKLDELDAGSGNGGRIVIVGNYTQDALFRAPEHQDEVIITAIDDASTLWIGERAQSDNVGVRYFCGGPTKFNKIRIEATKADSDKLSWNLVGNFHDVTINENVLMDRKGNDFILVLGAQGGAKLGGAANIKIQDATLNVFGGDWSEVVGSVRSSFNSQAKPNYNDSHIAEFANTDYHLDINVGGNAVIDKLFAHSRAMDVAALYDASGKLYNIGVSDYASCAVNLLGGKINSWCVKDQMIAVEMGYGRGYTTYIGQNFDLNNSFNADAAALQDSENYSKGYVKHVGISGESVFTYDSALDTVHQGSTVPVTGESYLIVESKGGVDRINEIKNSGKVRLDTFKYVGYGKPVRPVPVTIDTDEFYVGWTGTGDGKTPETFMNSIGWKTGVILDRPTTDNEGGYDEGTDDEEVVALTDATSEKYPEDLHLWYYFNNYGGTYVAVKKMYLGGATAIKNAPDAITLTAVDKNGHDYRNDGDEFGYYIMKAAPIGTDANGNIISVDPYYLRILNSEVIFDNITIYSRAGSELHPDNNYGIQTVTDSQNFYFLIDKGGRMVIKDTVTITTKKADEQTPYVHIKAGGALYLEKFGFSAYSGEGTIVLSDALIDKIYTDPTAYAADIALLTDFDARGGTISDEHGIFLSFNNDNVLEDMEGRIPTVNTTTDEIEYRRVVYVAQNGTGNGSSVNSALNSLEAAYEAVGVHGGTIVISGNYTLSGNFTEPNHDKRIIVKGINDAVISNGGASRLYYLNGDTTFENITFESTATKTGIRIVAQYNKLVMGDGIKAKGFTDPGFAYAFTVIGGFDSSKIGTNTGNRPVDITINSCEVLDPNKGICILALDYGIESTNNADINITINGGTVSRVYGTMDKSSAYGNIVYNINGGRISSFTFTTPSIKAKSIVLNVNGGEVVGGVSLYENVKAKAYVKTGVTFAFTGDGIGEVITVD